VRNDENVKRMFFYGTPCIVEANGVGITEAITTMAVLIPTTLDSVTAYVRLCGHVLLHSRPAVMWQNPFKVAYLHFTMNVRDKHGPTNKLPGIFDLHEIIKDGSV